MELPDDITLEKLRYDHKSNVNELIGTKWIWLRPGPHLNREYTIVSDADYVSREWEAAVESGLISISSFLANIRKFWCKSFVGHTGKPCIFCDYDGDQTVQYIPLRTAP